MELENIEIAHVRSWITLDLRRQISAVSTPIAARNFLRRTVEMLLPSRSLHPSPTWLRAGALWLTSAVQLSGKIHPSSAFLGGQRASSCRPSLAPPPEHGEAPRPGRGASLRGLTPRTSSVATFHQHLAFVCKTLARF